MAHFAKIEDSIVTQVIVADDVFFDTFVDTSPGEWLITELEPQDGVHFRKNYAGAGMTYDPTRDAFIAPQAYPSWTLNEDTCQWESPVPCPDDDDKFYEWDEETTNWKEII